MYNCVTPSVSAGCFHPTLHFTLGTRVDMASQWGEALCAVVPAPRAACLTVMDWRLQVLFFIPSGRNGAGLYCGSGSAAAFAAAPSTAALAGALFLEVSDKLHVHCH